MKQKLPLIFATILLAAGMSMGGVSAASATQIQSGPHLSLRTRGQHLKHGTSTNWAGYAVETSLTKPQKSVVSDVSGQWIVPTVTCPTRTASYSSSWIGMDGYSDNTVEQTGTEQDCQRGQPQYYAWTEFYPQSEVEAKLPIKAGDSMKADVNFSGTNTFGLTITDLTTNKSVTVTRKANGVGRQSAEWIAEAPSSWTVLPLANFGTMIFTQASTTINGHTGTISDPAWQNDSITMLIGNTKTPKATTSALSTDGSSFGVSWIHN